MGFLSTCTCICFSSHFLIWFDSLLSVVVCLLKIYYITMLCYHNKMPKIKWLKQQNIVFLEFGRPVSLRPRYQLCWFLLWPLFSSKGHCFSALTHTHPSMDRPLTSLFDLTSLSYMATSKYGFEPLKSHILTSIILFIVFEGYDLIIIPFLLQNPLI